MMTSSQLEIRVNRGPEIGQELKWDWDIPQFGISGKASPRPLLDACRALRDRGVAGDVHVTIYRKDQPDWDMRCTVAGGCAFAERKRKEEDDKGPDGKPLQ